MLARGVRGKRGAHPRAGERVVARVCAFAASGAAVGYPCAHWEVGGGVRGVNAATQWSDAHDT
jgi:hypothetical protein